MHTVPRTNEKVLLIYVGQRSVSSMPGIAQEKGKRFMTSKELSSPAINSSTEYLSPVKYLNDYFMLRNY